MDLDFYKTVWFFISVTPQTPTLSVSVSDATLLADTDVNLTCVTGSTGSIIYTFFKGSTEEARQDNDNVLSLEANPRQFKVADTGVWTCTATIESQESEASNNITLRVVGMYTFKFDM